KQWVGGAKPADCARWEADHGRAYALILAGGTLFVGGQDSVTAIDAKAGKVLWHDSVNGQARSLAAADGRLLVSTTEGEIACYGPERTPDPPRIASRRTADAFQEKAPEPAALAERILEEAGKTEGLCLALGAGDGRLAYELARQSKLTVYCVEPDARAAAAARRALDAAGLHGVRVIVHQGSLEKLAYPDYFADLIVIGDGSSRTLRRCSAREVYRVLRPCGGVAWLRAAEPAGVSLRAVGRLVERVATLGRRGPLSAEAVGRWLREGKVPEDEIQVSEDAVRVVRGELPRSDDWTHQYASAERTGASGDRRARLPLKLLWFGKPGPARLITRHWGGPAPLCVDGRMFVPGQYSLMAYDAYNGRELWRRKFPRVGWWPTRRKGASVVADADGVYLAQKTTCLRLDPATGETLDTYTLPTPPAEMPEADVKNLRWCYLAVGHGRILGMMGGETAGRAIFVLGKDGQAKWTRAIVGTVNLNSLSMDAERVYAIEHADPKAIAKAKRRGESVPGGWRLVALDASTGKEVWTTAEKIKGRTELWLSDGVLVATSSGGLSGYEAATGKPLYTRAARLRRFPVIVNGTIYAEPFAYDLGSGEPVKRLSPLTGESAPWRFTRSYGCGAIAGSPHLLMFRSGTLGFYDLKGDGGVFNFGGVRAGCYVNAIAASGLVLCPPADAACTCSYSFRTTVALAPAEEREQWGIFYDRLPSASVREGALNLGAPGDRRGPDGRLWLALPRPATRTHRRGVAEPFRLEVADGGGPYRRPADSLTIEGTDRPWLYASGMRGLRRAELDLAIFQRGIAAWPAPEPPKTDGYLIEPAWEGGRAYDLPGGDASVTVMADEDKLYLACVRRGGGPPKKTVRGADARVWEDRSFEVYLSPVPRDPAAPSGECVHLGVSASGGRYDARWKYRSPFPVCDIPQLEIAVDGKVADWGDGGLRAQSLPAAGGKMRPADDFDPAFQMAWDDRGLLLLARVRDDAVVEAKDAGRLWEGDSIEVFMANRLGTNDGFQLIVAPGADPTQAKPRWRFYDHRKATRGGALRVQVAGAKTPEGYLAEILLPWQNLKLQPRAEMTVAVQLFVNDRDKGEAAKGEAFRARWHPGGHPYNDRNADAFQVFRLSDRASQAITFQRSAEPGKDGLHRAVPPYPFPLTVPPLGAEGESAGWTGEWSGGAHARGDVLVAEMAIPWATLAEAGLSRGNLMLNLAGRGPLARPPRVGRGYERLIVVPPEKAEPRSFSVRLHFAELEAVEPGERVFDVKLQGKMVLERFDVAKAAGGPRRAVVRQFDGVRAARSLTVELVPRAADPAPEAAPILSAIEILPAGQ
ncbi:MAG: PQQ-binding-like beta-propeller repeat protein, partial [Planctomycetota bacterium]